MPLIQNNQHDMDVKRNRSPSSKFKSITRHWKTALVGFSALLIGVTGYSWYVGNQAASAANKAQQSTQQAHYKIATKRNGSGYKYGGQNSGIPNASQLSKYRNSPGKLTTWGYAGANVQPGLKAPLKSLPINEGASNKVLAYGYGTTEPGYFMGRGNNVLAIHNFADGVTFGSPLQYVNVNAKPKFYQTNGKQVFTYRLTKKYKVGRISSEYAQAIKQTAENKVTLVTCDEPNMVVNLNPNSRVIVSGQLVKTQNFKDAPKIVQAIFPQLMR